MNAISVVSLILFAVQVGVLLTSIYALVHAILQRPDAYTATEKITKQTWVAILIGGTILSFLPFYGYLQILGPIIAMCAAGVYLADVRPRLLRVQGKIR